MTLPLDLDEQSAALESQLPAVIAAYPNEGEFWMAFARPADEIEMQAGQVADEVSPRIASMLAKHD